MAEPERNPTADELTARLSKWVVGPVERECVCRSGPWPDFPIMSRIASDAIAAVRAHEARESARPTGTDLAPVPFHDAQMARTAFPIWVADEFVPELTGDWLEVRRIRFEPMPSGGFTLIVDVGPPNGDEQGGEPS